MLAVGWPIAVDRYPDRALILHLRRLEHVPGGCPFGSQQVVVAEAARSSSLRLPPARDLSPR